MADMPHEFLLARCVRFNDDRHADFDGGDIVFLQLCFDHQAVRILNDKHQPARGRALLGVNSRDRAGDRSLERRVGKILLILLQGDLHGGYVILDLLPGNFILQSVKVSARTVFGSLFVR